MAIHYEKGLYRFRIETQGWEETKEKKLPMLVFTGDPIAIIIPQEDGTEVEESVHRDPQYDRKLRLVIDGSNEQMLEFAMKKLRYAGFQGETFADLDLVGKDVRATCGHDQYKGKDVEQWDFALPNLANAVRMLDSSMTRKLDALFGKKLKDGKSAPAQPRSEVVPSKPEHAAAYDAQRPVAAGTHRSTSPIPEDAVPF